MTKRKSFSSEEKPRQQV